MDIYYYFFLSMTSLSTHALDQHSYIASSPHRVPVYSQTKQQASITTPSNTLVIWFNDGVWMLRGRGGTNVRVKCRRPNTIKGGNWVQTGALMLSSTSVRV